MVTGADKLFSTLLMTTLTLFGPSALLNACSMTFWRSWRGGCCGCTCVVANRVL